VRERDRQRLEEDEVLGNLPICLAPDGTLPRELQHLAPAINRLASRGVIVLLSNGLGPRWAQAIPGR